MRCFPERDDGSSIKLQRSARWKKSPLKRAPRHRTHVNAIGTVILAFDEARYWDSVAAGQASLDDQALWRDHSDAINVKLLARWLPLSRVKCLLKTDVFDEAFGRGLYPSLASKAKHRISIDIAASTLEPARARYPDMRAVKADVRCVPFAADSFDVIVSNSTLDHFASHEEIVKSLRDLRRTLRPGGQLVLTMDNPVNPAVWLRNSLPFRWLNRLGIVPYYIGATCGPRRLRRILQQVGFEVLETTAILHCPRVVAVALARYLEGRAGRAACGRFLRFLMAFERLEHWPTRYLTGYFVAVRAHKP
jgi:SAM-dependent methyltransferase